MQFSLTDEQRLLRQAVREFAEAEIAPHMREWDVAQRFPPTLVGKMAELGDESLAEHDAVGRLAVRLNVGKLVAVGGREASWLQLGAYNEGSWGEESVHVSDAQAAIDLLRSQLRPGDVVLVKASRSVGLESVAQALLDGGNEGEVAAR